MINFRPFTRDEAFYIVQFSRCIIERALQGHDYENCIEDVGIGEELLSKLILTRFGVFVTIEKIINSTMDGVYKRVVRGSIGILPTYLTTLEALKTASTAAALRDPRRTPLHKNEFNSCVLEIMFVSSEYREVSIEELHRLLIPGYHLIVIDYGGENRSVIMPHTQLEVIESLISKRSQLSIEEVISEIIRRACNDNRIRSVILYETQIFYEIVPEGEVIERKIYLNKVFRDVRRRSIDLTRQELVIRR